MALLLHLDTSGSIALAMLARNGQVLLVKRSEGEREHAGNINRIVAELFLETGESIENIDAIVVCNGPGSYTGLRIGLATAKGYCYVLEKSLILHNRLLLMAHEAILLKENKHAVLALLPARTGEYFAAGIGLENIEFPGHFLSADIKLIINNMVQKPILIGTVQDDLQAFLIQQDLGIIPHETLNMEIWAKLGWSDFTEKKFKYLAYAEPDYLKNAYINKGIGHKMS